MSGSFETLLKTIFWRPTNPENIVLFMIEEGEGRLFCREEFYKTDTVKLLIQSYLFKRFED